MITDASFSVAKYSTGARSGRANERYIVCRRLNAGRFILYDFEMTVTKTLLEGNRDARSSSRPTRRIRDPKVKPGANCVGFSFGTGINGRHGIGEL